MVAVQRKAGLAGAGCAMVRHDYEYRFAEPGLLRRLGKEIPNRIICIFHRGAPAHRVAVVGDAALGIGVGPVVAYGHYLRKEGLAGRIILVAEAQGHVVAIFVAGAPDVGESDFAGQVVSAVHNLVAVARIEGAHIVEIAVAAIEEAGGVALRTQHLAGVEAPSAVGPLDDALAGAGRYAERERLEASHGAVAGGEEIVENQSGISQRVDVGRDAAGVAVASEEVAAEALHGNENDVLMQFGAVFHDVLNASRIHLAEDLLRSDSGGIRQGGIELPVIQLVAVVCLEEVPASVLLELGGEDVAGGPVAVAVVQPEAAAYGQNQSGNQVQRPGAIGFDSGLAQGHLAAHQPVEGKACQ